MKKFQSILVLALILTVCLMSFASCSLENWHIDINGDGFCDICKMDLTPEKPPVDEPCTEHVDADGNGKCDKCGAEVQTQTPVCTEHKDENLDGKCDACGAAYEWKVAIADKGVTELYATKTLELTAGVTPVEKPLRWTSSDESVATVVDGLVTAHKAGVVTIRVALTDEVYDEITLTVKASIISTDYNSDSFDLSGIYQEDAVVKSNGMVNSFVAFAGQASKYYVATATVVLSNPSGNDTWSRVGISHFNGTNSYYGFQVSPGVGYNQRKVVTMIITDGNVQWGEVTDRSQIWNQHGMAGLDYSNLVLTTVRAGNVFYAFINGELYWVDHGVNGFEGDTIPVLNLGSCEATYSNLDVQYGEESVKSFLATADNSKFYGSFDKEIIKEDGSIQFIGASDASCNLNPKDHGAKYIGTNALLGANVSTTIEFDLTIDFFGGRDGLPALAVTFNRYEGAPAEARSLVIGQYKAGWTGWNSNANLPDGIGSGGREYMLGGESTRLEEGQTYHVVFTRVMTAGGQDTRMIIVDKDGNVLLEDQHGWQDGYSSRAVVSFLSRDLDCTISNIEIKEHTTHNDANMNGACDCCGAAVEWKVAITDKSVTELFDNATLQLSAGVTPTDNPLTWTSSDESVATVVDGLVTAHKAGKVTIRASVGSYYDEIELTVKGPVMNSSVNADHFVFSDLYSDNAKVASNGQVNSFAAFTGDPSKYYVASVIANITATDGGDVWSRVGISHFNGTNSYYGFQVSPGVGYNQRKTVTMIITDGNVQWGTVTDRSQVWGQHNLASLDYSRVEITVVRNGAAFYAFVNGELYYVDEMVEGFSDIDTLPVINVGSCTAEFTNMSVAYGETAVAEYLATADDDMFYGSYGDTIIHDNGSIEFVGAAEGTCNLNAKDHAAKSIGTAAVLGANVTSTVEFDLKIGYFGGRDGLPALAVTINRYDANVPEGRSLVIGQYKAGWTGWNINGNLNDGIGSGGVEYRANGETTRLEEGQTYHVVFIRVMTENGQDTRMIISDKDGNVLIDHQHGWQDGYRGRVVLSFLCRDVDCTISNIEIK